ncbi:hypothetical protein SALBM217S_05371 [Streptomyces griseoloalbus]
MDPRVPDSTSIGPGTPRPTPATLERSTPVASISRLTSCSARSRPWAEEASTSSGSDSSAMYAVCTLSRIAGRVIETVVRRPPGPVDPRRLVQLGGDALDRGDEEHRVEPDEPPDDDEHHGRHRRGLLAQPRERVEPVEAEAREDAVEQAGVRVVHLRPDQTDDDRRHDVGEERDDPVERRSADSPDGALAGPSQGDGHGDPEGERQRHQRHEDREKCDVAQRLQEDVVLEHLREIVEADEVVVGAEAAPVGHRPEDRLAERDQDEDHEDGQRDTEEREEERHPVERRDLRRRGRPPRAAGSGRRLAVLAVGIVSFIAVLADLDLVDGVVLPDLVGDLPAGPRSAPCRRGHRRGTSSTAPAGRCSSRRSRRTCS